VDTNAFGLGGYNIQDDLNPADYAGSLDWNLDTIPGTRDLEDHARLWLYIGGLQTALANGNLAIGLKWVPFPNTAFGTNNSPSIKLFQAVESDGGSSYLTDSTIAAAQVTGNFANAIQDASGIAGGPNHTIVMPPTSGSRDYDFVLPQTLVANLTSSNSPVHLLFEGCTRGQGELTIVILRNNNDGTFTSIGQGPGVYIDLKDIKELYERWTVGDGDGLSASAYPGSNDVKSDAGTLASNATISTDRLPAGVTGLQYDLTHQGLSVPGSSQGNDYILFVHGWNLQPWKKDAFAETACKRLYWQGYTGGFGAFQWPTTFSPSGSEVLTDYDDGEYAAWLSAPLLEGFLTSNLKSNNVYILAHSMGNIVTGEALRIAGQLGAGTHVNGYLASQAAVPGQCWDPNVTMADPLSFDSATTPNIPGFYGPSTPNIYDSWMAIGGASAAGPKSNFYNSNDYALTGDILWPLDQVTKPDDRRLQDGTYYCYASSDITVVADLFKANRSGLVFDLHLGNAAGVIDRYEIMAYAAEPRSYPLGAVATSVAGFTSLGLPGGPWTSDPFSTGDYSEHPWHSGEFRFDNMIQNKYWHAVLGPNGFDLLP
jgi:hypothetical protein